jgi:hypothetical protein
MERPVAAIAAAKKGKNAIAINSRGLWELFMQSDWYKF